MFQQIGEGMANAALYPFRHPIKTVVGSAAIAGANHLLNNPTGGVIDAVTGNAWNLRPDEVADNPNVNRQAGADAVALTPLQSARTYGERAAAYQQLLQERESRQALEQAMAMELLNGYVNMVQSAGDRAAAAAQTRF